MSSLQEQGFAKVATDVPAELKSELRKDVFATGKAGVRCLLEHPLIARTVVRIRSQLVGMGILPGSSIAIQAIAFDKTADSNWKVPWHQDLMFPFASSVRTAGYLLPTVKDRIHFAQPPLEVLNELLAVRLHLDDCDACNGPLRVATGTHLLGIIPSDEIPKLAGLYHQTECLASEGEAILMRPLLLHASSQASEPKHRRVVHFVFHSGAPIAETWAQAV